MRLLKNLNEGRPKISRTPFKSFKKAWLTVSLKVNPSDSISLCIGVLLPTTSTFSSASAALIVAHSPGMGRLPPALIKSLLTTDGCTPKSATTHVVLIQTDSGFSNLSFSALLCNLSTGTSRGLRDVSHSPAPATWLTSSPCDEAKSSTTTTLSSVLRDKVFFSFKMKHVAIRQASYYMVYLHKLSLTLNFSNCDEFVCQQKQERDFSRIPWGMEIKVSSIKIFNSLSCLNTNIIYITQGHLTSSFYPSRLALQTSSRLKRKLRNVLVFAS